MGCELAVPYRGCIFFFLPWRRVQEGDHVCFVRMSSLWRYVLPLATWFGGASPCTSSVEVVELLLFVDERVAAEAQYLWL